MKFQALWSVTAAAAVAVVVLGGHEARSQAAGPFAALGGSWAGSGTIKKSNGSSERIRCRSVYEPNAANVALRMRCASDSYNIDMNVKLASEGGTVSGEWQEITRNVSGSISGQTSGGGTHVQVVASAPGVTSNITVATRGNHQQMSIVTPGTEVPEVVVSLEKR